MAAASRSPARLVLDTNVVVAGLLWSGPPRRLLQWAIDGRLVELFSSSALIDELAQTLKYPKFAARMQAHGAGAAQLVSQYSALVSIVTPAHVPRVVPDDADDDHVIAAAVAARAALIVTGDRKHLLPVGRHEGIAIITAREAIERLQGGPT